MIENYSDKYLSDLITIIENFHRESIKEYDSEINKRILIEKIKSSDPRDAFMLILNGKCEGILYGLVVTSPTSGKQIFQEVIWFVNERFRIYGVTLLKKVEKILKSRGISIMIMAVMENSKTEKIKSLYERLGFKKMETHYTKEI